METHYINNNPTQPNPHRWNEFQVTMLQSTLDPQIDVNPEPTKTSTFNVLIGLFVWTMLLWAQITLPRDMPYINAVYKRNR